MEILVALRQAVVLTLWLPAAAQAHAILVESTPAINATAPAGHIAMRLRFNSRIDGARSRLTLVGPEDTRTLTLAPSEQPDVLVAGADLAPGKFRLRWQVLAVDGHITRGEVPFVLTAPKGP